MAPLDPRLRAADVLPLVAAAAIPLVFLHVHYQAHATLGPVDVYGSDVAIAVTVASRARRRRAASAGSRSPAAARSGSSPARCSRCGSSRASGSPSSARASTSITRREVDRVRAARARGRAPLPPPGRRRPLPGRVRGLGGRGGGLGRADVPRRSSTTREGPRPGQREVSFLGHQDLGALHRRRARDRLRRDRARHRATGSPP